MSYIVKFREPKSKAWEVVEDVIADDIMSFEGIPLPVRVLLFKDKTRLEIPMTCIIEFSKERGLDIEKAKEN
jgi:hypothetical protein